MEMWKPPYFRREKGGGVRARHVDYSIILIHSSTGRPLGLRGSNATPAGFRPNYVPQASDTPSRLTPRNVRHPFRHPSSLLERMSPIPVV